MVSIGQMYMLVIPPNLDKNRGWKLKVGVKPSFLIPWVTNNRFQRWRWSLCLKWDCNYFEDKSKLFWDVNLNNDEQVSNVSKF